MEKQTITVTGIDRNESLDTVESTAYTILASPSLKNYPISKVMAEIGKALSKIQPIENHTL